MIKDHAESPPMEPDLILTTHNSFLLEIQRAINPGKIRFAPVSKIEDDKFADLAAGRHAIS
jgi:hypothetical protein